MMKGRERRTFVIISIAIAVSVLSWSSITVSADTAYQKPPKAVLDSLNAPNPPIVLISPAKDKILLIDMVRYPAIADLAQPMLRLAGLRINPNTNGPHRYTRASGMTLVDVSSGASTRVSLPVNPKIASYAWSADGRFIAFSHATPFGTELWVADASTAKSRKISGIALNAAYGEPFQWMPDQKALLVQTIPAGRGRPPAAPAVPSGPTIQENMAGKKAPVWTFQDLLENAHDENLFDYYATSQLGTVEVAAGKWTPIGKPGIIQTSEASPDGKLLLVSRVKRPYSYLVTHSSFPKDVEVWDLSGTVVHSLASLPLQEQVMVDGVPTGPRSYHWRSVEPATLVWTEALDDGNPRNKVPHRDRILALKAPFKTKPAELGKTEFRFAGISYGDPDFALLNEFDRNTRRVRTWLIRPDRPTEAPRKVWDLNMQDRYRDPGTPVMRVMSNGRSVVHQNGSSIYLTGAGASPEGDRPFLDEFDLGTLQSRRIYRCAENSYEAVLGLLSPDGSRFLTRHETSSEPPNILVRSKGSAEKRALTSFADPLPQLRKIRKQLVTYKRPDGVQLSFTLYLPPEYRQGDRLPTVIWAYPREFVDPQTASQVTGSSHRFLTLDAASHLFFLTQGYAVLDNASMPVVGDAETVNNTYIEQIVASAKAAIDKSVEMGVTDRNRVGVGGHSYGAFMTANLLSHSDLFRAGIARSGAYNRTLTPFGFQQERRMLWEAPETYFKMSPFMHAQKINTPILLIHGEADNNSGTFPVQSERYYHALKGNGKTVRYVTLPLESHGYAARESIEHTLYEMISWFDRWVKNAGAKSPTGSGGQR